MNYPLAWATQVKTNRGLCRKIYYDNRETSLGSNTLHLPFSLFFENKNQTCLLGSNTHSWFLSKLCARYNDRLMSRFMGAVTTGKSVIVCDCKIKILSEYVSTSLAVAQRVYPHIIKVLELLESPYIPLVLQASTIAALADQLLVPELSEVTLRH